MLSSCVMLDYNMSECVLTSVEIISIFLLLSSLSSPAGISKVVTDVIQSISPDIADMLLPAYHQALAMANLVLEQIEQALKGEWLLLIH